MNIFVETALCTNDNNDLYQIPGFQLYRNDVKSHGTKTPNGTAIYVEEQVQPLKFNCNDIEMTSIKVSQPVYNLHIVGIYCSKSKVKNSHFIDAL